VWGGETLAPISPGREARVGLSWWKPPIDRYGIHELEGPPQLKAASTGFAAVKFYVRPALVSARCDGRSPSNHFQPLRKGAFGAHCPARDRLDGPHGFLARCGRAPGWSVKSCGTV